MKFAFSLQKREVNIEADVEKIVDKELERRDKRPPRKTRYQIKQEEKRRMKELEHKQRMQDALIGFGILLFVIVVALVFAILGSLGIV